MMVRAFLAIGNDLHHFSLHREKTNRAPPAKCVWHSPDDSMHFRSNLQRLHGLRRLPLDCVEETRFANSPSKRTLGPVSRVATGDPPPSRQAAPLIRRSQWPLGCAAAWFG